MASAPRVAVAHEWVTSRTGSDRTFEALARAFPEADLFALTIAPTAGLEVDGRQVRTTFLDRSARTRGGRAWTLPLMPLAWQRLSTPTYDLVVTSSHAFARWFGRGRARVHVDYCHTPMRYAWAPEVDRRGGLPTSVLRAAGAPLRAVDRWSLRWVDAIVANSAEVARRVRRAYGRTAQVIPPPVAVDHHGALPPVPHGERPGWVLAVSRFIPYKRLDLAIEACALAGRELVVAGHGPLEARLRDLARRRAPGGVRFVVDPDDAALRDLYRHATVLLFPAHEDFGIVPVEAQAAGTPVLALARGGASETVVDGRTGRLVADQTPRAFAHALSATDWASFDPLGCRTNAAGYSAERFEREVRRWAVEVYQGAVGARPGTSGDQM